MSPLHALQRAPTPDRPGPGPMPEALLRALDVRIGRRVNGLLAGDYRSELQGDGTGLAQVRPYVPGQDRPRVDPTCPAATSAGPPGRSRRVPASHTSASTSRSACS